MKKLLLIFCLFGSVAQAQMTVETFTLKATGDIITFLKYLPPNYDRSKKYPVLVSLSGDGEKSGAGIAALQGSGINKLLSAGSIAPPFIIVSPQCPYENYDNIGSSNSFLPGQFATEMLDTAIARYGGDPSKCYISGLSMGGPSVPNALSFFPNRWAAGISIASWESEFIYAPNITGALWDIKLEADPVSGAPDYNISFLDATKSVDHRYTVMQGSGHWIWDQVYSGAWTSMPISLQYPGSTKPSDIYAWLAQYSLGTGGIPITVTVPITVTIPITVKDSVPLTVPVVSVPSKVPDFIPTVNNNKQIPSKIEAEQYDVMNGVGLEACSEGGGDVTLIDAGDYMDYNVTVLKDGFYRLNVRFAGKSNGQFKIRNASGNTLATINLSNTGDLQKWKTVSGIIRLKAGNQMLRLYITKGGFNLNYLEFI